MYWFSPLAASSFSTIFGASEGALPKSSHSPVIGRNGLNWRMSPVSAFTMTSMAWPAGFFSGGFCSVQMPFWSQNVIVPPP